MKAWREPHVLEDVIAFEEIDAPVAVWTLDDLDQSADLGSVRSAWVRDDDAFARA